MFLTLHTVSNRSNLFNTSKLLSSTNSDLLNSTHLLYLISADSHVYFMSYFCNIKGQTRQARWLLTNLTFYNQISGFFLLLQYVSNQDLIYLVFILNPFLKINRISLLAFTTTSWTRLLQSPSSNSSTKAPCFSNAEWISWIILSEPFCFQSVLKSCHNLLWWYCTFR